MQVKNILLKIAASLALSLSLMNTAIAVDASLGYDVGVYYFPGWKNQAPGAAIEWPWVPLANYPERTPLLGQYAEGSQTVMDQHLTWMKDFGVDFVVFDWYWNAQNKPYLDHAIKAYLTSPLRSQVQFSILWANHSEVPENLTQFTQMVDFWIAQYFKQPSYRKIDGKPVITIFAPQQLRDNAAKFGYSTAQLFALARTRAQAAGLNGIYFVASVEAIDYWVLNFAPSQGYDALSAYNYHRGFSGTYIADEPFSQSYAELDMGYRKSWDWILANSALPYFVPVTSGWDARPWRPAGVIDTHDQSAGSVAGFRTHLQAAKARLDANPVKSKKTLMVCCWNEFGEGSYIEPTIQNGTQYLQQIKDVF